MTDLDAAIAELRRVTPANDPWRGQDFNSIPAPIDDAICAVLNAVISGELARAIDPPPLSIVTTGTNAATEGWVLNLAHRDVTHKEGNRVLLYQMQEGLRVWARGGKE